MANATGAHSAVHAVYVRPNGLVVVAAADVKPPATRPSSSWPAKLLPLLLLLLFAMLCTLRLSGAAFFFGTMTPAAAAAAATVAASTSAQTPPGCSYMQMRLVCWRLLLLLLRVNANFADLHANVACTNIEANCSKVVVVVVIRSCCCCLVFAAATQTAAAATAWLVGLCDHSWVSCARTVKQTLRPKKEDLPRQSPARTGNWQLVRTRQSQWSQQSGAAKCPVEQAPLKSESSQKSYIKS